jgi:hypothetical protein
MDFSFDIVWVAALIVGIVEAAKEFGFKKPRILACALGFFFYGLSFAIDQALIPEAAHIWIKLVVFSLSGAVAAMGYFDLINRYFGAERNQPG